MDIMKTRFNLDNDVVMEHVCAVTTLSPKLMGLLQIIATYCDEKIENHRLAAYARNAITDCAICIAKTKQIAEHTGIPVELLDRAESIYSVHNAIILAASIQEKIKQWKFAFTLAAYENSHTDNYILADAYHSLCDKLCDWPKMTVKDMSEELINVATELEAWIEIELPDAFEAWENENGHDELNDLFNISSQLRLISFELIR